MGEEHNLMTISVQFFCILCVLGGVRAVWAVGIVACVRRGPKLFKTTTLHILFVSLFVQNQLVLIYLLTSSFLHFLSELILKRLFVLCLVSDCGHRVKYMDMKYLNGYFIVWEGKCPNMFYLTIVWSWLDLQSSYWSNGWKPWRLTNITHFYTS